MISVIIPILNEAKIIDRSLSQLIPHLQRHELIIVDGGSTDDSMLIAEKYGQVLASHRGRARQMNVGAEAATGDILLFLHADVRLDSGAIEAAEAAIAAGYVGGGFKQRIEGGHILFRLIEQGANFRAQQLQVFYGDGGIFICRTHFYQIGGFPDIPILEEMEFSRKLRNLGKTALIEPGIQISSRRWKKGGIVRTTVLNWFITALYSLGVSPFRLARLYSQIR